ncbi:hypothetical protein [Necropsobacter massiliensis]|uniref:hypothetical protein n=1 Tax=Necropsobacter massiliensis TaxID=1400001 RepID=UPI00059631D2|nr:hypothetical protein [Necropsobacter massiliensis]
MQLVLLTFGERLENHYQAVFSVLTYLKDPLIKRVLIITDRPQYYAWLRERAEVMEISTQTLREWQGAQNFFWRIKIKALELAQQHYPAEHLLYVDSDTFLAGNLSAAESRLAQGTALMHKAECTLDAGCDKTLRKMHRTLAANTFAGIPITDKTQMWNAGVIGLPAQQAQAMIRLALHACDEMCATTCPRRLVEQFAFSVALNHVGGLSACDNVIGHYWGNKTEWNRLIAEFFIKTQLQNLSLTQAVESLRTFDWQQIPLSKKQRNTNAQLKRVIDKLFKPKNIHYFS